MAGPASISFHAQVLPFAVPALGGLLFGYDIGATSGAVVNLTDAALSGVAWGPAMDAAAQGLLVSGSLAGALGGSVLGLTFGDALGRRREMLLAAACYIAAAAGEALAPGYWPLVAARALYGIGIGFAMHVAPLYLGETAPSAVRGTLVSLKEGVIVGGILLGYVASSALIAADAGWRLMYGISIAPALLYVVGALSIAESPRWLLLRGGEAAGEAARTAMGKLRGADYPAEAAEREVREAEEALVAAKASTDEEVGWGTIFSGGYLRAFRVGAGLILFQQITGQPSVLYFATSIFQSAGFAAADEASRVSVLLGVLKLAMTGVAVALVDKAGRRPLLIAGVGAIAAMLFVLGFSTGSASLAGVSVVALLAYVSAYQVSFGPISWLVVSEVFPARARSKMVGMATTLNFGSNALVAAVLPTVQQTFGQSATFYVFGAVALLALGFVATSVPETAGKSLEEIEAIFLGGEDK